MIGAAVGALLYERIFSTKVCLTWLSDGCFDPRRQTDKISGKGERSIEYVVEPDKSAVDNGSSLQQNTEETSTCDTGNTGENNITNDQPEYDSKL